jgi:hypothetical protein
MLACRSHSNLAVRMILKLTSFTTRAKQTLVEIDSRYLTVATSYRSSSGNPVSFDLEDPVALDCSSILRDVFFLHDFPNLLLLHLFKFFIDGFMPFLSRP